MTPERWATVERLFQQALARADGKRDAFLAEACAGDTELRHEIESLLAHTSSAQAFVERDAVPASAQFIPIADGSTLRGRTLGAYKIEALIGAGGMGEVYRARDMTLARSVAIKVLPSVFLYDPDRLARFKREAQTLAALNHPNIATIHGLEQSNGIHYLVMELVTGETLAERIGKGALRTEEALSVGGQIAEALEAAHKQGVVHRDLKPANVKITPEGRVKVLDFGLAKTLDRAEVEPSQRVTLSQAGFILGTPAYMSPEQARGEPLDCRTDLFSFGIVLYEMLTGRVPFPGKTTADVFGAILEKKPAPASRVNSEISPRLDEIISKSLEKDRTLRYQSAADLRADLLRVKRDAESSHPALASSEIQPSRAPFATRPRWVLGGGIVTLAAGLIVGAWLLHARQAHALTERDTIVLAEFANRTGDPVFNDTLRQGLSVQLEQSPFLTIVSDAQIQQTLGMMGREPDVKLTAPTAREICQRTASAAVLEGSISQIGQQYNLILRAANCSSGASLASADARAPDKDHVLEALGRMASDMRNKLGESLNTQKFDTPLEQATTSSLEALQAFTAGYKVLYGPEGSSAAIPFFKRATQLDPQFALAYSMLGRASLDVQNFSDGVTATQKAFELRDRVSAREKYFIEASYDAVVTGNLEKAKQACELWIQAYPRAVEPRNFLAGIIDLTIGDYQGAVGQAEEAVRSHPDLPIAYAHLMFAYAALNRLEDAKDAYRRALARHIDSSGFIDIPLYLLDFLDANTEGMAQLTARAAGKAGIEDIFLANEALTAAYAGRLRKARELSQQAEVSAQRLEEREAVAAYMTSAAVFEALFGYASEARRDALEALKLSAARDTEYAAALALGFSGDVTRAQALAQELNKRFPEDTMAQFNYVPTLRARIALNRHDVSGATEALRSATPYEFGEPAGLFGYLSLYPIYVRGEALLAAQQGREAAVEFRKIVDHRGMVFNEPIGALAHLGLARAYSLQGLAANARTAYQDFFTLWKNADPDIPLLREARSEFAKL